MTASSTSTLSLAGRLRDMGDPELVSLLTLREVRDSRVRDFFDLADALLDPASIQRALAGLDRSSLAAIASLGTESEAVASEVDLEHAFALALLDRVDGPTGDLAVHGTAGAR
jgi:hypothetical protein